MLDVCFQTTPGLKEKVGVQMGQDWLSRQVLRLGDGYMSIDDIILFLFEFVYMKGQKAKYQATKKPVVALRSSLPSTDGKIPGSQ